MLPSSDPRPRSASFREWVSFLTKPSYWRFLTFMNKAKVSSRSGTDGEKSEAYISQQRLGVRGENTRRCLSEKQAAKERETFDSNFVRQQIPASIRSHELNPHHSKALYKAATLFAAFPAFFSSLGNAQLREGLLSPFGALPPPPAKVSFAFPFADFCGG